MPTEVSSPPQSDSTAGVSSRPKSAADTDDDDLPTEGQPALTSNWFRRAFGQHEVGAWFISAAAHTLILVTFGLLFREVIKQARSVDVNIATKTHVDEPLENLPAELSPGPAGGPSEVQQTPGMFDGDPLLNNLGAAPIGIPDLGTPTKNHDSGVDAVPGMKVDPLASTLLAPTAAPPGAKHSPKVAAVSAAALPAVVASSSVPAAAPPPAKPPSSAA